MLKNNLITLILSFQLFAALGLASEIIPNLPPKEKEELDEAEPETKRPRVVGKDNPAQRVTIVEGDVEADRHLAQVFAQYVAQGDVEKAEAFLDAHPDAALELMGPIYQLTRDYQTELITENDQNIIYGTPLHIAAFFNHPQMLQFLLELAKESKAFRDALLRTRGATQFGETALLLAAGKGHVDAVKVMLEFALHDPSLHALVVGYRGFRGCHRINALVVAIEQGQVEVVRLILQTYIYAGRTQKLALSGEVLPPLSIIFEALDRHQIACARAMLEMALRHPPYRGLFFGPGLAPIENAVIRGLPNSVALLLELASERPEFANFIIPDYRENPSRRTILHDAVSNGQFGIVELLLRSPLADRFYLFEGDLMNSLLNQMLNPTGQRDSAAFATRVLMRRLIIRYRPSFANRQLPSMDQHIPVEMAFFDADMPRLRALLLRGTGVNPHILRALFAKLGQLKTEDGLYEIYLNHHQFMQEFARLTEEIENESFREAMFDEFGVPPNLQNIARHEVDIRFPRVQLTVTQINEFWIEWSANFRRDLVIQAADTLRTRATNVFLAILFREISGFPRR